MQIDAQKSAGAPFIAAQHNCGMAKAVALDSRAENPPYPGHSARFGIPSET